MLQITTELSHILYGGHVIDCETMINWTASIDPPPHPPLPPGYNKIKWDEIPNLRTYGYIIFNT